MFAPKYTLTAPPTTYPTSPPAPVGAVNAPAKNPVTAEIMVTPALHIYDLAEADLV